MSKNQRRVLAVAVVVLVVGGALLAFYMLPPR